MRPQHNGKFIPIENKTGEAILNQTLYPGKHEKKYLL